MLPLFSSQKGWDSANFGLPWAKLLWRVEDFIFHVLDFSPLTWIITLPMAGHLERFESNLQSNDRPEHVRLLNK